MAVFYYFVLLAAVPLMIWPFLKEKHVAFMWIGTFLGAIILFNIGTYRSCASGWVSPSIGSRGACSHNGGVVSNLNDVGYIILVICAACIMAKIFMLHKADQAEKKEISESTASFVETKKALHKSVLPVIEREKMDDLANDSRFEDYEKFVIGWHQNGLSVEEITSHLKSKGVVVSCEDVYKYLESFKYS
jgi:hypothetical protein